MKKQRIAIVAGGTGGHFFPAKALALQLKKRGYSILFLTDKRIDDLDLAEWEDIQQFVIASGGIAKKSVLTKIKNTLELCQGIKSAYSILKTFPISAIIGFGGYPSIPPLLASRLLNKKLRPPILLHEGNAIIGRANRLLLPFASIIATSFPKVHGIPARTKKIHITGLPIRPDIVSLYPTIYTPPTDHISLLVWGGSLGAKIFSDIVPQALANLPIELRQKLRVTQQVRQESITEVSQFYQSHNIKATLAPFFTNVADLLKEAHLVIGRSGGSSVAELALAGRPAIFIPYPYAANNEQFFNALAIAQEKAGWIIKQDQLTSSILTQKLVELFANSEQLSNASIAHKIVYPYAAENLADLVENHLSTSSYS